ncbi:MAG: tRNA (adenosine(37)-N6)-threonylcarbamoyltransferase complex ATPase subunit type 1 TsaE [Gemmatimonadales bacterium]
MSPLVTETELQGEGELLGGSLPPRAIVLLRGEIGAGKTTFIKAIARGLGVEAETASPTYALVHRYEGRRGTVFHIDCYRLRSPDEARDLDWEGLLEDGDVLLIEWPDRAGSWLPAATHEYTLAHVDDPDLRSLEQE